jgi:FkbM family methyltransferase
LKPLSLLVRFNRPEYVFRPRAAIKRLRLGTKLPVGSGEIREVSLPWGQTITVFPDALGRTLTISGIFDLCLTESIHRLLDQGDLAVDVGANIGYVTNLMATRVGLSGAVIAFEPHPVVFEVLSRNVGRWQTDASLGSIEVHRLAMSSKAGRGRLSAVGDIDTHMGLASLRESSETGSASDFEVELARLDDLLGDREVQLLKIDVEGHEHEVLRGAEQLLARHRIRDVVFEDSGIYPTPAMRLLEDQGMNVLTLKHSLLGLRAHPVQEGPAPRGWPGPNYLATLDPMRALARLTPKGWRSLGSPARVHRSAR